MTVTLGVDWGSTHLRIHRLENGKSVDCIHSKSGAKGLIGKGSAAFEGVLSETAGAWLNEADQVYVTGMATSKNAWVETPYMECPSDLRDLAENAECLEIAGKPVTFLPGIADPAGPDVMRGEELQLLGLAEEGKDRIVILPGTHSKWVEMSGFEVRQFRTYMTGEIFDLARHHALCGRLAEGEEFDANAFEAGLAKAADGLLNGLFSARPKVLRGEMAPLATHAYLSGVAIGTEIQDALKAFDVTGKDVLLSAADPLARLYQRALEAASVPLARLYESATAKGFGTL